jgi:hypothetical protein
VPVFGDHGVAERLVETQIAGKLASYADADFCIALGLGVSVDPFHQLASDAPPLVGWVDGNAPHMDGVSLAIEAETGDRLVINQR